MLALRIPEVGKEANDGILRAQLCHLCHYGDQGDHQADKAVLLAVQNLGVEQHHVDEAQTDTHIGEHRVQQGLSR